MIRTALFAFFATVAAAVTVTVTDTATALAYIPPSSFVLKSLAQKHLAFAGVQIKSRVTVYDGGKATGTQFKVTTLFNSHEGRLFSLATDAADHRLYSVEKKMPELAPAAAVLFSPQSRAIAQILIANGIPVAEAETAVDDSGAPVHQGGAGEGMTLTRWRDTIAYVMGPAKGAQFWVEKDTFIPLRLLLGAGGAQTEVRFDNTRFFKEFPYPKVISALKGGVTMLQDEALEVTAYPEARGVKTPPLPGLKLPSNGMTDEGNSAPRELRDAIQQYYDLIR